MKPFLFLATRSDDEPADAEYEAFLKRTGLDESTLRRLRLEAESLPQIDLDDWSGILVGGSPFNASTPAEKKSATQKRVEAELSGLLDRVVEADFPFFGACYGVGTLACHQGAVVDTTYGEAVTAPEVTLTEAGLAVGAVTDAYSEDVPQGQVISQSVAAGTSLAHDSAVDIVLSKGREPLTVPTLSGLSASAAKSAIEDLGLVAAPTEAYSDTVAEGQVISQQTREGSTLHRGDSVAYTVSKGPEKVAIPDVVGLQREEARSRLESAGFTVKEEAILGGFFGTVRSSDPAAGTMTKKGSTVTITIV